jgi:hypothetical protein
MGSINFSKLVSQSVFLKIAGIAILSAAGSTGVAYAGTCTCASYVSTQKSHEGVASTANPRMLLGGITNPSFMTLLSETLPPTVKTYGGANIVDANTCWSACGSGAYANGGYVDPCGPQGSDIPPPSGQNGAPGAYKCFDYVNPFNSPQGKLALSDACQAFNKTSGNIYTVVGAMYNNGESYYSQEFGQYNCETYNPGNTPASTGTKGVASSVSQSASVTSYTSASGENRATVGEASVGSNTDLIGRSIANINDLSNDGHCVAGKTRVRVKTVANTFTYACQ